MLDMDILDRYILDHTTQEDALLTELDRVTNQTVMQPRMISGNTQGRFLKILVQMFRPRRVLEIGTFTGYSAICMASGLDGGGIIDTVEVNDELQSLSESFFSRSGYGDRIRSHVGSALDVVPVLRTEYDLVFMDGDKREYPAYYAMLMGDDGSRPSVHSGSVILADNVLWYGKVADERCRDKHTEAIRLFNDTVVADSRVECTVLPLRDGISMIRVK